MAVDADTFKGAMSRFASGVTVVTVHTDAGDYGMTASAFCSLSLEPPLVLVCVKRTAMTHQRLMDADGFAINLLSADQKDVSNRYAGWGALPQDDFSDQGDARGSVSGAPLLDGAMAWIDCRRHAVHDGGDHSIFVGRVEGVSLHGDRDTLEPLLYFAGSYRQAGERL
ncbi:MAG: flavin reductase family protein [Myxococcota bacterium]